MWLSCLEFYRSLCIRELMPSIIFWYTLEYSALTARVNNWSWMDTSCVFHIVVRLVFNVICHMIDLFCSDYIAWYHFWCVAVCVNSAWANELAQVYTYHITVNTKIHICKLSWQFVRNAFTESCQKQAMCTHSHYTYVTQMFIIW